MRPLILLSNDDGYAAAGIRQLADMVTDMGDVLVVAPDGGRSGCSMSFTSSVPLSLRKISGGYGLPHTEVYACSGTPCDCIKMAMHEVLGGRSPDIVLAGINHGDNAAVNLHYSGTMAVAIEGTLKGVPSVAFSSRKIEAQADFSALRPTVRRIVQKVLSQGLPKGVCLNVNYPDAESFQGIRCCRMDMGDWVNELERRIDPRGRTYYWVTGSYESHNGHDPATDTWALDHGYIAITPIQIDMTAHDFQFEV